MTGKIRFLIALIALAGVFLSAQTASAAPATWTVVSSASVVAFAADIGPGFATLTPQGAGSLITNYTGTISGDVTGSTLTISSAVLDALVSGSWSPMPGGVPGLFPADYGAVIVGLPPTFPSPTPLGTAAIRSFVYDASTAPMAVDGFGNWDATGAVLTVSAGDLDYDVPAFALSGTTPLAGVVTANGPSIGTLTTAGLTETLTLPVSLFDSTSLDLSGIPVVLMITGTIVATRTIPEPGTFVMLGLGAALLLPAAVRRYRRR